MLKNAGLVGSILFFATAVAISLLGWIGPDLTISQHIAHYETAIWTFRIIGAIAAALIGINLLGYVKPHFGFSRVFTVISSLMCIGALLVALFPHTIGISSMIHNISAYLLFIVGQLLSIVITLGLWQKAGRTLKIFGVSYFIYAIFIGVLLVFYPEIFQANVFYLETVYLLALFVLISALSYLKLKRVRMVGR